jgi:hypothetical protein
VWVLRLSITTTTFAASGYCLIGVVFARDLSRLGLVRAHICLMPRVLPHLIHADSGYCWVIGLAIHLQHVLHVIGKVPIRLAFRKHQDFLSHGFNSFFEVSFAPSQDYYAPHSPDVPSGQPTVPASNAAAHLELDYRPNGSTVLLLSHPGTAVRGVLEGNFR